MTTTPTSTGTTGASGRRTLPVAAALTLALVLGSGAARPAAAADQQPIDGNVAALTNDCKLQGGTATTDWTFDDNGDATEAVVSCDGLGDESWYTCADNDGYYCDGEPPTDLTGRGGVGAGVGQHLPGLPVGGVNRGGSGDGGTAAPSEPTPPSAGTPASITRDISIMGRRRARRPRARAAGTARTERTNRG